MRCNVRVCPANAPFKVDKINRIHIQVIHVGVEKFHCRPFQNDISLAIMMFTFSFVDAALVLQRLLIVYLSVE